ncbi:MAG: preprotein translocase subunit YajC [Acidobacteriota bacterium]|nr:preprotein translocase subunit YajC [Acidobacteriota bacterium]
MISFFLAQQSSPPQGGLVQLFFPFILVVGIFYLLIIRPMRTRQKKLESLITGLKNGDKVITTGGIYGTISGVEENVFVLKIADQVKMKVAKNAVASLQATHEQGSS